MKTNHLIFNLILIFLANLSVAQVKKDFINNRDKSVHKLGGVPVEGNLQVLIYDNANMQINRYHSNTWVKQWYGTSSKSIWLYADGETYSGDGSYFVGASNILIKKSCYNTDANTNELILEKSGFIKIKQTTYYPEGSALIYYTWEITNISSNVINDLRLFTGGDTFLYGNDYGAGDYNLNENTVSVTKNIDSNIKRMDIKGITTPFAFESQNYYLVYQHVISNALNDTIDDNEATDNGMALEYRIQSLLPGNSWIIYGLEKFYDNDLQKIKVTAPSTQYISPDSSINLNFIIQNCSNNPVNLNLSATINNNNWLCTIISPISPYYLPANSSQVGTINVSCPSGVPIGTNVFAILNASYENMTANDSCRLIVAPPPAILINPYNINVCPNSIANFEVLASNATNYQWQEYDSIWKNLSNNHIYNGCYTPSLNILNVNEQMNNLKYRCVVSNLYESTISSAATLRVFSPPSILMQPNSTSGCENKDVSLSIIASGTAIVYQWMVNDGTGFENIINDSNYNGANNSVLNIQKIKQSMNNFEYKCLIKGVCNPETYSRTAILNVLPTPNVSLGNDTTLNINESIILDAGPGDYYSWTNPQLNGRIVYIDASIVGIGTHVIGVTVSNANNCNDSDSIEITFNTATKENNINQNTLISISPNPTKGLTSIFFPTIIDEAKIEIINIQGKCIKEEKIYKTGSYLLNLSNFKKGVYLIRIITMHQIDIKKLIVE